MNKSIALHDVAKSGDTGTVELLLAEGFDINAKDNYGKTPLHWTADRGYKDIVHLLITKGCECKRQILWVYKRLRIEEKSIEEDVKYK